MTKPIAPAAIVADPAPLPEPLAFSPVPVAPRHDGWTAARQRLFIATLAETACVSEACEAAGVTARSAYRLRVRAGAEGFDRAWRQALGMGAHRLTTVAFDRAINGTPRQVWHKGEVVGEERVPSDRLLMYLLKHFDKARYGNLSGILPCKVADPCPERLPWQAVEGDGGGSGGAARPHGRARRPAVGAHARSPRELPQDAGLAVRAAVSFPAPFRSS